MIFELMSIAYIIILTYDKGRIIWRFTVISCYKLETQTKFEAFFISILWIDTCHVYLHLLIIFRIHTHYSLFSVVRSLISL